MEFILRNIHKAGTFGWLYAVNLFVGFHYFSIQYIHSSFLLHFMSRNEMGLLIAFSSVLAIVALSSTTSILARFGAYRTALAVAVGNYLAVLGLALFSSTSLIVVCFAIHMALFPMLLFCLDVFLENRVEESEVGNVHGIYLSVGMLAALLSPILAGYLVGPDETYPYVYYASALFLLPALYILHRHFRTFVDPLYRTFTPIATLTRVFFDRNLFSITFSQFLMRFYFAWMVVYLPIYLNEHIGFSWPQIGLILFLMLIPYILVEWPAGLLADKVLGEKELLILGFVLTAVPTGLLALSTTPHMAYWVSLLCVSRVGTALIESMTETYFFKQVGGHDADLMSYFRILRPLAFVAGPIAATILLMVVSMQYLWLVLAGVMLLGVVATLFLTDTK